MIILLKSANPSSSNHHQFMTGSFLFRVFGHVSSCSLYIKKDKRLLVHDNSSQWGSSICVLHVHCFFEFHRPKPREIENSKMVWIRIFSNKKVYLDGHNLNVVQIQQSIDIIWVHSTWTQNSDHGVWARHRHGESFQCLVHRNGVIFGMHWWIRILNSYEVDFQRTEGVAHKVQDLR